MHENRGGRGGVHGGRKQRKGVEGWIRRRSRKGIYKSVGEMFVLGKVGLRDSEMVEVIGVVGIVEMGEVGEVRRRWLKVTRLRHC
jgi:hypothetical protein